MMHSVKSIELQASVMLQYVEQGETSGLPVVFLHGVTDSWRSFEPGPAPSHAIDSRFRSHAARPR